MIEYILFIIALIPTILGLAEILHIIKLYILKPRQKAVTYMVICLYGKAPQQQLLHTIEKKHWLGKSYTDNLIAINSLIANEDFDDCKLIAEKNNVIFCSAEEFCNDLKIITGF